MATGLAQPAVRLAVAPLVLVPFVPWLAGLPGPTALLDAGSLPVSLWWAAVAAAVVVSVQAFVSDLLDLRADRTLAAPGATGRMVRIGLLTTPWGYLGARAHATGEIGPVVLASVVALGGTVLLGAALMLA
ncbi:hypothetical protein [Nocardioides bruguierae]|uniref:Uncharacterized protein n=1 Tax=Nocardioides bruguierae TaxID=2945102 RepID=A0A9X2D7Y8_9ACTN|nr:hypothetical protein [Nocardioides bruguierae]MCL8026777.1 hypothetical protein [Nocardioides bruguierae]MCM0621043.1 hypothetical protein [Nocardioides bruguierae]